MISPEQLARRFQALAAPTRMQILALLKGRSLCVGALAFYSVLFRARLVPRWLSGASLLTALLYLPTVALAIIGVVGPDGTTPELMVLAAPFALMEMVLALWLIAKGFETPIASD